MGADTIPEFNSDGYLPRGEYRTAMSEIKERFEGNSAERKELFKALNSLAELLGKHRAYIKRFLVDGSFTTKKESPADFDCILILKEGFDFSTSEAEKLLHAKKLFNAHLFIFMEEDVSRYRRLIDFFGHDREGNAKGMIEVIL